MTIATPRSPIPAAAIAPQDQATTQRLAYAELDRFVSLLEQLEGAEWSLPTHCDLWDVRDVVAHQCGHVAAGGSVRGLLGQGNPFLVRKYRQKGRPMLDAINQAQVEIRRNVPVQELVRELREGTKQAIAKRARMGRISRRVPVPVPDYGMMGAGDLLHVILPRDMWVHRLDIADATGRTFVLTADHDGALVERAVADVDRNVRKLLPGRSVTLRLEGEAGGAWLLGKGDEVAVEMTVPDFLRTSSRRVSGDAAVAAMRISSAGDTPPIRIAGALVAPY